MKEKTIPLTIRLPQKRVALIKEMADTLGVSTNKLASIMLEAGFVLVDELDEANDICEEVKNG